MSYDFNEVSVSGLTKTFGPTLALAGVDLRFERGTVTVIQGSNGSGKSTLLWLLALLARPTNGEIRFGQYGANDADALRGRIGFVAHQLQLYPGLTGRENLLLAAKFHQIPYAEKRASDLSEALQLEEFWNRPLRTYSRGQAQRVSIARALLHEPRLLLMDEPSTGLDHEASAALLQLLQTAKAEGTITIVVTHEEHFAQQLTDRVVQLSRGRVVEPER